MKFFFSTIALVLSFTANFAQTNGIATFYISSYNTSANDFFKRHPDVKFIELQYEGNRPDRVDVFFHNEQSSKFRRYFLAFDGDKYYFDRKYPSFPLPNPFKLTVASINKVKGLNEDNSFQHIIITARPDSLIYHYSVYTFVGEKPKIFKKNGPYFRGSIDQLKKAIEKEYKKWQPIQVRDSVIIMKGLVNKTGKISPWELIEGRKSTYTDKVLAFMDKNATSWRERFEGVRGRMDWYAKICVTVKKHGSIEISILEE